MSLIDILGDAGAVASCIAGAYVIVPCGKELFTKYYIPWANEFQKKCDKEEKEAGDDYNISSN